jgi:phenolic acid decarboxylase
MNKPSKEIQDKILFLWNKNKGKSFETFIKQNNDVNNYLENLVKSDKWFKNKRRAFVCVANGIY